MCAFPEGVLADQGVAMKRFCVVTVVLGLVVASAGANDKKSVAMNEKEQAFADLMKDAVLVGNFTVNREMKEGDTPKEGARQQSPERYGIKSIEKRNDSEWLVNSQIKYGKLDVTVPVPVQVHFANDTPVLSVTDLSIPLVGSEFTARVMFFDNQYAGTWRHGKVGGLMYGRVEKAKPADSPPPSAPAGQNEAPKTGSEALKK
jgi:hypothetical protein